MIGFQTPSVLSIDDNKEEQLDFYYEINNKKLVVTNPTNLDVSNIEVYNTSGQSVYNIADILNTSRSEYSIENLTSGLYIIRLSADDGFVVTKKVTVK